MFTREELLRGVWGFRALGTTRTLDSHACRLRRKLRDAGGGFVVNVWGVGLPPARRVGGLMGALLTEIGWALAGLGAAAVLLARRTVANRDEAVARILHELRGPVTAARLGLALGARGGELSAARVRAVDLELKRASLALQDLGEVRRGGAPGRPGSGWERHRPRGARRGGARRPASARRRASARRPASARRRDAEFDVVELLSDSVEVWRAVAVARGARLEFNWRGAPAAVRGERVRIAQATGNLIHNAIEHGEG